MDQKYPEEYTNKYWDGVFKEAQDELREKFGVKGDTIKLAWNIVFISIAVILLVTGLSFSFISSFLKITDISFTNFFQILTYILFSLFLADVLGLLIVNFAAVHLTALFSTQFKVSAKRDWNKQIEIDNREIEILRLKKEIDEIIEKNKVPTPGKYAYDMILIVEKLETKFKSIASDSTSDDIRTLFTSTDYILDELINDWLPQTKRLLRNADKVKNAVFSINAIRNNFVHHFDRFLKIKQAVEEYLASNKNSIVIPQNIREPMIEVSAQLWGHDNSFDVQIQKAIDTLLSELRQNI